MQPAGRSPSPVKQHPTAATQSSEKKPAVAEPVVERESPEQEAKRKAEAADRQKMFEAGAATGGVAQAPKVSETKTLSIPKDKDEAITKLFADTVEQIIRNPEVEKGVGAAQQNPQMLELVTKNIAFIESHYSAEEKAICNYLTELATAALKPLLKMCSNPIYSNAPDSAFEPAIKRALQLRKTQNELDKVQDTCKKLKEIYECDLTELVATRQAKKTSQESIVSFHMVVVKEVVENPLLLMTLMQSKMMPGFLDKLKGELKTKQESLSKEESALLNHLSTAICAEYKPLLAKLAVAMPQVQGIADEAVLLAMKQALMPSIKEKTLQFAKLYPDHLDKLVKIAPYQEHVLALGMLQPKVDTLARQVLEQLKAALTSEDKELRQSFFVAHSDNVVVKEIDTFLKGLPENIVSSIVLGLLDQVNDSLRRKAT